MPSLRTDPLDELVIPDGTVVEEHDLVTEGDVLVGGQSVVEFGVRGGSLVAGERVTFGGHIEAEGDCRLDMWCEVADNVLVGEDAYLGERVHVDGELKVAGDLDIGDDVDIEEGFEANGWIVIRNPMPTIVFLFVYLSQLLRIGEEEAAEEMLSTLVDDDRDHQPLVIPRNARLGDDSWRVSTPARIGDGCRLHGNVRAESLDVGRDDEIFGSLRAKEEATVRANTVVSGNVTTRNGDVRIGPGVHVRGDVAGETVEVHRDAEVDGAIRAREEMLIRDEPLDDARPESPAAEPVDAAKDSEPPTDVESTSEAPADPPEDADGSLDPATPVPSSQAESSEGGESPDDAEAPAAADAATDESDSTDGADTAAIVGAGVDAARSGPTERRTNGHHPDETAADEDSDASK